MQLTRLALDVGPGVAACKLAEKSKLHGDSVLFFPALDLRNSSVEKFPSREIPRLRAPWAEPISHEKGLRRALETAFEKVLTEGFSEGVLQGVRP